MVDRALAIGGFEVPPRLADMERFGGARDEQPATGLDWVETLSFANWLNRQHGYPLAYDLGTPDSNSIWEEGDPGFDQHNIWRNSLAVFAIPTADEWHKAAYYDPNKNGGDGGYWQYPTGSDLPPTRVAEGAEPDTAVWGLPLEDGPADIKRAGGLSPYGVMGMGGNVHEWEESSFHPERPLQSDKAGRGGSWSARSSSDALMSHRRGTVPGGTRFPGLGFRVVMLKAPDLVDGDYDGDGQRLAVDIDRVSEAIDVRAPGERYDLNKDGIIDTGDHQFLVGDLIGTSLGDADLNGAVEFADFLALSRGYGKAGGWASGDFDGSGEVGFSDFLILSSNYDGGTDAAAVPEPACHYAFGIGMIVLLRYRRRGDRPRVPNCTTNCTNSIVRTRALR